ncbi:MAG: protein kinase, partial [Rhodospirillales bacterium]|nr:protein kinase [Rhodospirillales bacterium]
MPESGEQIRALSVGSDIKGYRVESLLSQTELGLTYLARDLAQDLVVSIQEYFPTDFANREANGGVSDLGKSGESSFQWGLERFVAKASQLIGIKHPSISRVIQVLQAKGTAYAVMEHSDGETLAQRLEAQGTLSEEELKAIAIPLIAGLRLLHGADLVHRDVRPENIILSE